MRSCSAAVFAEAMSAFSSFLVRVCRWLADCTAGMAIATAKSMRTAIDGFETDIYTSFPPVVGLVFGKHRSLPLRKRIAHGTRPNYHALAGSFEWDRDVRAVDC